MYMTRKITSFIIIIFIVLTLLTGCNSSVNPNETNQTNNMTYSDYSFWEKQNQVRITLPISIQTANDPNEYHSIGDIRLSDKYLKRVEELKVAMITYFKEIYNIDISDKLNKQQLKAFKSEEVNGSMVMGYVVPESPEYLNLNTVLFSEYKELFDNTYVHESLHQIGFVSEESTMLTEGIVDALTDLILRKANIKSVPTDNYYESRIFAYQILATDQEIAEFYLNNTKPSLVNRISDKLEKVEKPFENVDPGERLEELLTGLSYGYTSGGIDIWYLAFEAQEIVRAYCQSFNPSKETIDCIRSYYLVEDYENVGIYEEESSYHYYDVNENK